MLEQLHGALATASYPSTGIKTHAAGLAGHCGDELRALGVDMTQADTGTATTVAGAIACAKIAVNAQNVTASFSGSQKQQALGRLDLYAGQIQSLGLS